MVESAAKRDRRTSPAPRDRKSWSVQRRILEYTGAWNLGLDLRELHRLSKNDLNSRIAGHGITPRMWPHLWILFHEDGLQQIEIARRLNMEGASVVATLNQMERQGFVRRVTNDKDRRVNNIWLTEKAKEFRRIMMAEIAASNEKALQFLTGEQVSTLFSLLRLVNKGYRE